MPFSTDIRLPRTAVPVFPDRCVACGRPHPGDFLRLSVRASGLWDLLLPWLWFTRRPARCEVPACPPCRAAAVRQRRIRFAVLVLALCVSIPFVMPWVKSWGLSRGWTRLLALAIGVLPLLPWGMWLALRPPPVDLTVGSDVVDYEFADAGYARDFAAQNRGEPR